MTKNLLMLIDCLRYTCKNFFVIILSVYFLACLTLKMFFKQFLFYSFKMQKSPINILQEISVRDGYFPIYTYITINNSTNNNRFACKVTCKDISANGIAKNKKEAKQIAAENMLLLMNKGYKSTHLLCQAECTTKNNMENPVEIDEIDKDLQDKSSSIYFSHTQSSCTLNYVGQLQVSLTIYLPHSKNYLMSNIVRDV